MQNKIPNFFRPSVFLIILSGILLFIYWSISPSEYLSLFWSSKIVSSTGLIFIASTIVIGALFARVGESINLNIKKEKSGLQEIGRTEETMLPRWWVTSAMLLAIIAYIIWFTIGIIRAGGPVNLYNSYLSNAFYVKQVLLDPIPGITSFTQLGVIAVPMALINSRISKAERTLVCSIIILAIIRSFLFSERLALLEMIIPIMIVYASKLRMNTFSLLRGFIIFAVCVIAFFIFNESRRSFSARGISTFYDVLSSGIFRFFGYYLTSINNYGLSFENYDFKFPFLFTFSSFWSLPGLSWLYGDLFPNMIFDAPELLSQNQLNPELNVFTTVGYWVMEYGSTFTLIIAAFYGFFSGVIFNLAKHSSYWLVFYSVWFIGILEFMRIYYIGSPRIFIPFVFFVITLTLRKDLTNRRMKP